MVLNNLLRQSRSGADPNKTTDADENGSSYLEEPFDDDEVIKPDPEKKKKVEIAAKEKKAVVRGKLLVYLFLFVFAFISAALTFTFVRKEEYNDTENEFHVFSNDLLEGAQDQAVQLVREMQTLSVSITSHALETGDKFPYVILPHFHARTEQLAKLSGAEIIMYTPTFSKTMEHEWNDFVIENREKIFEYTFGMDSSLMEHTDIELYQHKNVQDLPLTAFTEVDVQHLDPPPDHFSPVMQFGPEPRSTGLLNLCLNSHPIFQRMVRDGVKVNHTILDKAEGVGFFMDYIAAGGADADYANEKLVPRTVMAEPIFDSFDIQTRKVVGFVWVLIPFASYLEKNMPDGAGDFLVDVDDSCGDKMAYTVNGREKVEHKPDATRQASDREFDDLIDTQEFAEFARYDGPPDSEHERWPTDSRHCNFTMTVYPSEEFEEDIYSKDPWTYATIVFAAFLAPVLVFALYDWVVQRRQKKIEGTARRTTELVHTLFPEKIGDRMLAEAEEKEKRKPPNTFSGRNQEEKLKDFMANGGAGDDIDEENAIATDPIAESFPETTIMFADIAGFTAWSSAREPKQVFILLETIYKSFDAHAKHLGVYKVETIGDCYVAVCGCPHARKDHATVMARFARDCMYKFRMHVYQLEETLGSDTTKLRLRAGLHSGPITAGVLRTDRARFQLFGDTMNTASRMESTGSPNRIQASNETAQLLTAAGKSHWISEREDKVNAKGKGELTTYWLNVSMSGGSEQGFTESSTSDNFYGGSASSFNGDAPDTRVSLRGMPPLDDLEEGVAEDGLAEVTE